MRRRPTSFSAEPERRSRDVDRRSTSSRARGPATTCCEVSCPSWRSRPVRRMRASRRASSPAR
jgi:hypothetical protein